MKPYALWLVIVLALLLVDTVIAHPGSGIIVSPQGDVFFVDNSPPPPEGTGKGLVWKLARDGKLMSSADMGGGHWLAFDQNNSFARFDFQRWFSTVATISR